MDTPVSLPKRLPLAFGLTVVGMTIFEVVKQSLHPDISIWQSHTVTIVFASIIATIAAYLASRKQEEMHLAVVHELSERKKAQAQLAVQEENLRITLDSIGDAVIATNASGKVTRMNPVAEKLTGWRLSDAAGRPVEEVFQIRSEKSKQMMESIVGKVLRDGLVIGLANHTELLSKDGNCHPIADSAAPIRDSEQRITGVVLVFRDQTQERESNMALEASEELLRLSQEIAHIGSWEWDLISNKITWSAEMYRIHGQDPQTFKPELDRILDLYHAEDRKRLAEHIQSGPGKGAAPPSEIRIPMPDGSEKIVWVVSAVRKNAAGAPASIVGVHVDISARKQLEANVRQAQKVESIGLLAGGVAHDFNNILTSIIGFAELARQEAEGNGKQTGILDKILTSASRGAALTQQLLAFARKKIVRPEVVELNSVLNRMEPMLNRLIGEDIDLGVKAQADLGAVKVDLGSIEQVIMNLAVNARDAMPKGGKLTLETMNCTLDEQYAAGREDVTPGPYVMLAVCDTGTGMSKDIKTRIFEPFFTTKPTGKGTGLGLSMCHGIIKQAGGHIAVYSEVNKGTCFKIYLPRVPHAAARAAVQSPAIGNAGGKETILLVEDDETIRQVTTLTLTRLGYQILSAADGVQAVETLKTQCPQLHLLLTDVVMPKMGGKDLAAKVQELCPGVKILFTSGYTENAIDQRGILLEGVHFIQKPYSPGELAQKIREVLDRLG